MDEVPVAGSAAGAAEAEAAAAGAADARHWPLAERPGFLARRMHQIHVSLFAERCAGCHTLDVAGTEGSAVKIRDRERVDGPNFNTRKESEDQILYAIRNGGFSGAIMPENILVGDEADQVAKFLAKYSGRKAKAPIAPDTSTTTGP